MNCILKLAKKVYNITIIRAQQLYFAGNKIQNKQHRGED